MRRWWVGVRAGRAQRSSFRGLPVFLPVLAAVLFGSGSPVAQPPVGGDDAARAIIFKALERAVWYEEHNVAARYRSRMTKEVRRFDGNGDVRTRDVGDYEVVPIDGVPFERRLTIEDRPLNAVERGWVAEREAEFREELRRRRERDDEPEEDENAIVFNEELVARYVFTLEGEEPFRNRPSHRIAFEPRPGRLPVRRRIDYALNKAKGRVWIDRATHEPARVEFELIDRVRLWWGMLGSIQQARGSLDRGPVLGDVWARIQFESYSDVRVVFRRTRRSEFRQWRDFELLDDVDEQRGGTPGAAAPGAGQPVLQGEDLAHRNAEARLQRGAVQRLRFAKAADRPAGLVNRHRGVLRIHDPDNQGSGRQPDLDLHR